MPKLLRCTSYQLPQANYINVSEYLHEIYDVTELSNFENYKDEVPVLRNIAEENNLGHIKISHVLVQGNLIPEIQKITKKENIDFVVMGTKGATGLKETFLGTVATKVMNDVKAIVFGSSGTLSIPTYKKNTFCHAIESRGFWSFKKSDGFRRSISGTY